MLMSLFPNCLYYDLHALFMLINYIYIRTIIKSLSKKLLCRLKITTDQSQLYRKQSAKLSVKAAIFNYSKDN